MLYGSCIHEIGEHLEKAMAAWLHTPYFLVALGLMAILQTNQFLDGKTTFIESILAVIFGGIFWGAIATYVGKKMGKIK